MKRAAAVTQLKPSHSQHRQSGKVGLVVALAMLGAVLFFAWRRSASEGDGVKGMTVEELYRADQRMKVVLQGCDIQGIFETDTTDVPGILASKLDAGAQLDPLRRARTDLAAMGEQAAEPLQRVFQNAMGNQWKPGVVKNILGVCALSESNFGVSIAMDALRHPAPDVRGEALIVLKNHPDPENYDAIRAMLDGFKLDVHLERAVSALHVSDPERFAGEIDGWINSSGRVSGFIKSSIVDVALPLAAHSEDPEIAKTFLRLEQETEGLLFRHHSYLLAPSARHGNEESLQTLRDSLASPETQGRYHALRALEAAGHVDDGFVLVEMGETAIERGTVLGILLDPIHAESRTDQQRADLVGLCRRALQDEAVEVQEVALRGLLRLGDPEGTAHMLRMLQGTIDERSLATRSMRDSLDEFPETADQARAILIAQWDREVTGSQRSEELISILAALSGVPGEATGQFIADTAEVLGENTVRGTSGFHWAIGQLFNAGEEAQQVLRQRIKTETAPLRRIDLIQFLWQDFSEESADILLGIIDDDTKSPFERLYASERVLYMGQPERVLPVLKRVYRTSSDDVLRPGLHCLLWAWFGPPPM